MVNVSDLNMVHMRLGALYVFGGQTEVASYPHIMILLQAEVVLASPILGLRDTG